MGSTKSLRYEVLVYPTTTSSSAFIKEQQHQRSSPLLADDNSSSINPSATTALFETKLQRFTCDRENMQQYWIPEGYHPVLIPRAYLTDSFVATSNNSGHLMNPALNSAGNEIRQLRSRNNDNINDIELRRRRRNVNSTSCANNDGTISKKRRRNNTVNFNGPNANRRTILGQSQPSPSVNITSIINRQKMKERISAIRNSAVTITSNSSLKNNNLPNRSPAMIIGDMWNKEPENIKKHYERLAIRKKIAQALAFEQKISSISSTGKSTVRSPSRNHHVNPTITSPQSNAVEGVDAVNCPSFNCASRQNVASSPSSPISRPIPDWMTRSDDEDYDENSDIEDNDSTIATVAC